MMATLARLIDEPTADLTTLEPLLSRSTLFMLLHMPCLAAEPQSILLHLQNSQFNVISSPTSS